MRVRSRPFALVVVLLALLGCTRGGPCVAIVAPDGTTRATVSIEVANTTEQRERGLMFRKHLDEDAGMIFVFADSQPRDFWMHNTEIPLDMMFADSSFRITGIVADAKPETDTLRGVDDPSQFVLEVNGGFCAKNGIKPGDRLDFSGFSIHTSQ